MSLYHIVCVCAVISMAFAIGHIGPHHHPHAFGYSIKDHHGEQHREESGIGGHSVKGSYGFKDDRGIHRQVDYVADHAGFRAEVKTNEPGTANQNPAAVKIHSSAHPYFGNHAAHGGYGGHGYGHGGYGGHGYGHSGFGEHVYALGGFGGHGYGHVGHGGLEYGHGGLGGQGYGHGIGLASFGRGHGYGYGY